MKETKKLFALGLGTLMALTSLTSCEDDPETPAFDAISDIYIQKITDGDQEKYAPVFYAYSNRQLEKVIVTGPTENKTYDLTASKDGSRVFMLEPTSEDFTTEIPEDGDYKFKVISTQNDTLTISDKLLNTNIEAIKISSLDYDQQQHEFDISWNEVDDAKVYIVKILNKEDDSVVYMSTALTKTDFQFNKISSGWVNGSDLDEETEYTVAVYAYNFESKENPSWYDIQMECVDYRDITW